MSVIASIELVQALLTSHRACTDTVHRLWQSLRITSDDNARELYRTEITRNFDRLGRIEETLRIIDGDGTLRRIVGH